MTDSKELYDYQRAVVKARAVQSEQVMPLIGGLLDAWDGIPNDTKSYIREQAPVLADYLEKIDGGMCADIGDET